MKLRFTPALGALAACLGAAAIVSACDASSTEGDIAPLTGVRIDTLGLLGADSCGTADGQIAKLAVLLEVLPPPDPDAAVLAPEPTDADAAAVADATDGGNVDAAGGPPNGVPLAKIDRSAFFDCFAEPTFLSDAPVYATFRLRVFGYSAAAYAAGIAADAGASALDPAIQPTTDATNSDALLAQRATVVATCLATQQADVRATAVCTIDRDSRTSAAATSDAGSADASDADPDAATDPDASTEDAGDAGETTDAGTDAADAGDAG